VSAGYRRVAHPYLLVGPTLLLRARLHRLTKQGPLRAMGNPGRVHQIRGHVPPLDPVIRVRSVIGRKCECLAGNDGCESAAIHAKPENNGAARKGAAGYRELIVHRQRSSPGSPAACAPVLSWE